MDFACWNDTGNGYIVAKSILKSTAAEREWIYAQDGYIHEGESFKYKSRVADRKVKDENGIMRTVSELTVAYWSERIEDQFRVMKGDLSTRPVFVRDKEHIKAHLLVCTIALIIMRIIQNRIVESQTVPSAKDKDVNWTAGLSAERVQKTLNK